MRRYCCPLVVGLQLLPILLLLVTGPALAGRNAYGALIVHTADYTFTADPCDDDYDDPGTCEAAVTSTNNDENTPVLIWFIAAFPDPLEPAVTAIRFGHDHNLPPESHLASGFCGPRGSWEWPSPGWPDKPDSSGNVVTYGSPVAGDRLFPFYWVMVLGFEGAYYGTDIHPGYGYAAFADDSPSRAWDQIERFGQVSWKEPGFNECSPPPPLFACCYVTGECFLLPDALCEMTDGVSMVDEATCDPNPCPQHPGACCLEDGLCELQLENDCEAIGGFWMGAQTLCNPTPCAPGGACCYDGLESRCIVLIELWCEQQHDSYLWIEAEDCDPNPCHGWPAVEQVTWGRIKSTYR